MSEKALWRLCLQIDLPVVPVCIGCHVTRAVIVLSLYSASNDGHTSEHSRLTCERHGLKSDRWKWRDMREEK